MKPEKNNNNRNNKRNVIGLVSIVLWALFFTILLRSCQSAYENADTVQVPYTTFKEWLVEDKIKEVNGETSQYTFTLREGVTVELPKEESSQSESWMNSLIPSTQKPTASFLLCWRSTQTYPTLSRWTVRPICSACSCPTSCLW